MTGAAGGIGRAFADRLAALGYNLALVDIDGTALAATAGELLSRHGVRVEEVTADLSLPAAATRLHDWCKGKGIDPVIVINNAGIFDYRDIAATDPARIETMVGLHVATVSIICRLFGSDMAGRGGGYILNMSSYSAWMPWPGLALYSATKAYIHNFSRALALELQERGVVVTTVLPAGVTTGLYGLTPRLQRLGVRLGVLLTPERVALRALGAMFRGRRRCVPGFVMWMLLPVVRVVPRGIVRFLRRKTVRYRNN